MYVWVSLYKYTGLKQKKEERKHQGSATKFSKDLERSSRHLKKGKTHYLFCNWKKSPIFSSWMEAGWISKPILLRLLGFNLNLGRIPGALRGRCKDSAAGVETGSPKSRDVLLLLLPQPRECCWQPGKDSSGLTWNGVVQDEGDAAPDEHGCGEQDVQHLINACYSCSNRENLAGLLIIHILIYSQAKKEHCCWAQAGICGVGAEEPPPSAPPQDIVPQNATLSCTQNVTNHYFSSYCSHN